MVLSANTYLFKNEALDRIAVLTLITGSVIWSCGPAQVIAIPIILAATITAIFCKVLKCFLTKEINQPGYIHKSRVYPVVKRTQVIATATAVGATVSLLPIIGSGLGAFIWGIHVYQ